MSNSCKECDHSVTKLDPKCRFCTSWAQDELNSWKSAASGSNIFTFGFVLSMRDPKGGKVPLTQVLFSGLLTVVALVIQTVTPIVLIISLLGENNEVCPAQANAVTKLIGVALCLYFVTLTIGMCLSKLRGMGFLVLFITKDHNGEDIPVLDRLFPVLGLLSNCTAMAAAGVAQFLLFVKNADADNLLVFILQSLALQFVLGADQRLMNEFWTARVKICVGALIRTLEQDHEKVVGDEEKAVESTTEISVDEPFMSISPSTLGKVKLLYLSEAAFLIMVSVVGLLWTAALGYCM